MKHLILCREYPPVPGGGIGTYAFLISHLLAEYGETVYVISQAWEGAEKPVQEECNGRLIIHRVPFEDWTAVRKPKPHPDLCSDISRSFFFSEPYTQGFSWEAGLLAERLVDDEGIDLIEAQEYEAPLYYFLQRRKFGLGPQRCPPCIVHLHSPTEFIATFNDWNLNSPVIQTTKRLEEYTISMADALLCPSLYLSRQVDARYGIEPGRIEVIHLPKGTDGKIERSSAIWAHGSICYVGRLERRKGLLEWIRAAVQVARGGQQAVFEFIGANILGRNPIESELILRDLVPKELRSRFIFHGDQPRQRLSGFLSKARIAAVPSRWENFPYACVEAMSSGLPVLATRQGGMPEMIRDGHTGWLADQFSTEDLARTLLKALETPPEALAEMGQRASTEIEQICNQKLVLEQQIEFRNRVVRHPTIRSLSISALHLMPERISGGDQLVKPGQAGKASGILLVLTLSSKKDAISSSLQAIVCQDEKPIAVALVLEQRQDLSDFQFQKMISVITEAIALPRERIHLCSSKMAALKWSRETGLGQVGVVFMQAGEQPSPDFISRCRRILTNCEQIGMISFWAKSPLRRFIPSFDTCSSLFYRIFRDEIDPACMIRAEALAATRVPGWNQGEELDVRDLADALQGDGWSVVTIPAVLIERPGWLSPHSESQWNSHTRQPGLKLIEVIKLARQHPAFFLEMAAWLFSRMSKKFQVQVR